MQVGCTAKSGRSRCDVYAGGEQCILAGDINKYNLIRGIARRRRAGRCLDYGWTKLIQIGSGELGRGDRFDGAVELKE